MNHSKEMELTDHHACDGHIEVVKLLVQKSKSLNLDLNKANEDGDTPFHSACQEKHDAIIDFIIANSEEFDINLSARNENGSTGLEMYFRKVCEAGDLKTLANLTNSTTIDFNQTDRFGNSGFFLACAFGHVEAVKLLVQKSKSLNFSRRFLVILIFRFPRARFSWVSYSFFFRFTISFMITTRSFRPLSSF